MASDPRVRDGTKLDVEDEEERQHRIGNLLERLNVSTTLNPQLPTPGPISFSQRETYPVGPPTELLARVQDFLPRFKADNEALAQRARANPRSVDIENVEDPEHYISMNLGLGVFETRRTKSGGEESDGSSGDGSGEGSSSSTEDSSGNDSSDSGDESSGPEDDASDSDASSSELSSSDSDSDSYTSSGNRRLPITSRPIKPLPRRFGQKPKIEVLSDKSPVE
ncbi:hypothetical protein BV22DRAFT_1076932 [Leucogyrophana mollusca]|uniref:Uncharacterized protein n=1 Tax=Leucogyrophana mollusca TaxID=85980 RepID=A0ACB8BYX0_9AGAM|nr:hypothetical protein BV22DRAFT_1076932 [Leucogyrophana mollusca]